MAMDGLCQAQSAKNQSNGAIISPLLLTPRQAARLLNISEKTLYTVTRTGRIKAVRIGHAKRYTMADIQAFIDAAKEEI
ncbi:MAG: hypothetical protein A2Y76_11345 [Planctomycetes bacterium RBG_13_60_9]|nr:MAG: hypothetical protein A2Y76_11345 [Planctomycetes bacterium RBG_13_60_9]